MLEVLMKLNKKVILIVGIVLAGVAIVIAAFIFSYFSNINSAIGYDQTKKIVDIEEGSSISEIAEKLNDLGYLESTWGFILYARLNDKILLAGPHLLSEDMSVVEIIDKIAVEETLMKKVTTLEGWRLEQIAKYLENEGFADYETFVNLGEPHRGKLFPDTFFITKENTGQELIEMMLKDFSERTEGLTVTDADLSLAAIVEREAITDKERPEIAGVFKNRLEIGMMLEADPTVLYVNDTKNIKSMSQNEILEYKFWQPVEFSRYDDLVSPYNSYTSTGLPPTPICNPGLKSIEAAIKPDNHDYLYFFHSQSQEIYFSKTLEEHNQNKALYIGS